MKKQMIAVDVDDVLVAHVEAFIAFSNAHYGTRVTPESYTEFWRDIWLVDEEEVEKRAAEFHAPEIVSNFRFIEESREALEWLKERYDLFIVTARRKKHVDLTREYIEKYLPNVFQDIHFVPIWEPDNKVTKLDICKEIGADFLIDDLPRHCEVAASGGLTAILFGDYGWNQKVEASLNIVRCKDWQEVKEYFSAVK